MSPLKGHRPDNVNPCPSLRRYCLNLLSISGIIRSGSGFTFFYLLPYAGTINMSSTTEDKTKEVKKLQEFLGDMVVLGSLQGFRYFQPWLRGREELLLTVVNEDVSWRSASFPGSLINSPDEDFGAAELPYADQSLLASLRSQKRMSGCGHADVGLPPASPCDREIALPELNCTLFLLACYAKYQCPYVWIRSNHERLIKTTSEAWAAKDSPLKLNSTLEWQQNGILIWEIVAELVQLCTWPPPSNPFTLDIRYFESLPLIERFLASGAMANFLQRIVIYGNREKLYYTKVLEELEALNRFHVKALHEMQKQKLREMEEEVDDECGIDSSLSNGE